MIPKIIHYCWFGEKSIPEQQQYYINEWQNKCPEWEIRLWNENSFSIDQHPFVLSAYQQKKYAFVSDYVRVWALHNFGGVYLDTDVELKHSLNDFLQCEAFSCIEAPGIGFTSAVWGSCPQHSLTQRMLAYYENKDFNISEPANTITISAILENDYHINPYNNNNQIGKDQKNTIHIYASHYFCLDLPMNYASHHFIGSWIDNNKNHSYKDMIHSHYYSNKLLDKNILNNKNFLKELANQINFYNLIKIIRYYIKSKFR
ncbi:MULTISPECIES: glycosyltransferase family 32 protein [unclassified Acinetobacter]|uniref:glycosyltransferase family 32 protein n=1 Tax=unclassified Acinetobacter TaxID=196816 RepID=UPI0029352FB4|nr:MULTISPECIES: glycosyltransferase [unclassified Acinetobacter]WOE31280.1 glycosyltransferase [Acinetobacter sp. SAAs470]WOE39476.1 glycosyltransferase [Acinetobacter sp. SAAs474]